MEPEKPAETDTAARVLEVLDEAKHQREDAARDRQNKLIDALAKATLAFPTERGVPMSLADNGIVLVQEIVPARPGDSPSAVKVLRTALHHKDGGMLENYLDCSSIEEARALGRALILNLNPIPGDKIPGEAPARKKAN